MNCTSPTVFIIDDDQAVRESLAWLVESLGLPVRTFESAHTFLNDLDQSDPCQRPDGCLLVDIRLPGMSGLDLQDALARRGIDVPVIIITGHGDVPVAVRAMKAGAFDFIEKPFSDQVLLDRIREAMEHDRTRCDQVAYRQQVLERVERLSARERQVMELVVQGRLNKEIAADLGLSPKTIEVHRAKVMEKMEAKSLADLVRTCVFLEAAKNEVE